MSAGLRYRPNGDRAYAVYAEAAYLGEVRCERRNHADRWYAYLPGGGEPVASFLALELAGAALVSTDPALAHEEGYQTARSVTPGYDGPEGTPWGDEYRPGKARTEHDG